jgi:hypothetical protein
MLQSKRMPHFVQCHLVSSDLIQATADFAPRQVRIFEGGVYTAPASGIRRDAETGFVRRTLVNDMVENHATRCSVDEVHSPPQGLRRSRVCSHGISKFDCHTVTPHTCERFLGEFPVHCPAVNEFPRGLLGQSR